MALQTHKQTQINQKNQLNNSKRKDVALTSSNSSVSDNGIRESDVQLRSHGTTARNTTSGNRRLVDVVARLNEIQTVRKSKKPILEH